MSNKGYDEPIAEPSVETTLLSHSCVEGKEHAAMVLERIRSRYPVIDKELRGSLFMPGQIAHG
jgi:hypothetical protein